MINSTKYHELIKGEEHVFLCCVSGRSSSTAFQRIINSSNEVWMWGEPHGMIKKIFAIILHAKRTKENERVKAALNTMYNSYLENKHLSFYANAVGNIDTTIEVLNSTMSNLLKPWAPAVKRFGFKEIDSMPIALLIYLREIYPKSYTVFCFRDPLTQWPSLSKLKLPISGNLDYFLEAYDKMAKHYMAFARKYQIKAFIENKDLRDENKVRRIIKYLNISEIDSSLIDVTVHTIKPKRLTKVEVTKILESPAYKSYLKMQKISRSFYKQNYDR